MDKILSKPARGSIFPKTSDGIYLSGREISYQVTSGFFDQKTARILNGVNFMAEPKSITAILGPSGCGKTSLLNILSGRLSTRGNKLVGGSIFINGKKVTPKELKTRCCYIMQNEISIPYLTVEETLLYSAEMRLPYLTSKERREKVRILLKDLGLVHCMHKIVGNDKVRSISGGERKRVMLGVELVSDPNIIFIDEPTSGLDAFMAFQILQLLIKLAKTGRTIICTIHQPRTQIFQGFDEVILLSKGEVVYHGTSKSSVDYFTSIGYPIPSNYNPTDYYLDLLVPRSNVDKFADKRSHSISHDQLRVLPELFKSSEYNEMLLRKIQEQDKNGKKTIIPEMLLFSENRKKCSGMIKRKFMSFIALTKMIFMNNIRNYTNTLMVGILSNAVLGVLVGSIFFNLESFVKGNETQSMLNASNIVGALFFSVMATSFTAMSTLESLITFRVIFSRDRAKGLYGTLTYMLSKHLADFIFEVIPPLAFSNIFYFMSNSNSVSYENWNLGYQYLIYQLIVLISSWTCNGLLYFVSGLSNSMELAHAVSPVIMVIFMIVSGFFVTSNKLPVWLSWIKYVAFQRYSYSALAINAFPSGSKWGPLDNDSILNQFSIDQTSLVINCVSIFCLGILYRITAYFALLLFYRNLGLE
ncbi:hypothetical protein FG386_002097 [Cryptosporidium ryanae]|uniref:uncharacterized protein n=1 Tax=Cryptosporidium ryanae TaxID=515981 RepID=UPI00351A8F2E|nr:hypothetical protein FG386_002097 [Cryptosporidium ryanae]